MKQDIVYFIWTVFKRGDIIKKLENQKEIIFNKAKEILLSDNVDKFSIRMISRECNIGMGTIYKYYGNKDDILLDITRELWMSYVIKISSSNSDIRNFLDRIDHYFSLLIEYSKKFNYEILSKKLSSSFRKAGKSQHSHAQKHFIKVINDDLQLFYFIEEKESLILSNFISNNLIALITLSGYSYDTFRSVLEKIVEIQKEKMLWIILK